MRVVKILATLAVIILSVRVGWSQLGGTPDRIQVRTSDALINDIDLLSKRRPDAESAHANIEPARYAIVMVRGEAILLDTAKGDTWHLVFRDTEIETQLHWEPLLRKKPNDLRPLPTEEDEEEMESDDGALIDEELFDPPSDKDEEELDEPVDRE